MYDATLLGLRNRRDAYMQWADGCAHQHPLPLPLPVLAGAGTGASASVAAAMRVTDLGDQAVFSFLVGGGSNAKTRVSEWLHPPLPCWWNKQLCRVTTTLHI